jgi:hypothetical protein
MGKLFVAAKRLRRARGQRAEVPHLSEKLMDSRERNGDTQIPGHIVITYEDVHRAVTFVPPDWRVGTGANLESALFVPVRLPDVRELPKFVGGGPNVQFPRLALQLDQAGIIDIVTSLDGDVHHGPMLAATTTRDKPKRPRRPQSAERATWTIVGLARIPS